MPLPLMTVLQSTQIDINNLSPQSLYTPIPLSVFPVVVLGAVCRDPVGLVFPPDCNLFVTIDLNGQPIMEFAESFDIMGPRYSPARVAEGDIAMVPNPVITATVLPQPHPLAGHVWVDLWGYTLTL